MPLQNPSLEEAYDQVNYTITDCVYPNDIITIDLDDEDILKNFDITTPTINWSDINVSNPYQDICEYIGIDVNLPPEDFEKMCERYPALQKALEQFQNTYNLVKNDWETERTTK